MAQSRYAHACCVTGGLLLVAAVSRGGVVLTYESTWPDATDPLVQLDAYTDATERDVKDSRHNTQTFTITPEMGSFRLDRFVIGYNKIQTDKSFSLRILEVDAPNDATLDPDPSAGDVLAVLVDLPGLTTPSTVSVGTGSSSSDVTPLTFDLTGSDEVMLVEGKFYGIELNCPDASQCFAWAWAGADVYAGGAGYSDGTTPPSDYSLALVAVPEPATALLLALGLLPALRRGRPR